MKDSWLRSELANGTKKFWKFCNGWVQILNNGFTKTLLEIMKYN